jgi:outer membrane lipoprotein-sorting protein
MVIGSYVLALLMALPLLAQRPSQFSADIKTTMPGGNVLSTGKMFFGGEKVRMEMNTQGHQAVVIADAAGKTGYMLMPEQHMYMDLNGPMAARQNRPQWRAYDAGNPCADLPETSCQKVGTEVVDGRQCNKWQFTGKDKGSSRTVWIDQKSGIPVKAVMSNGATVEITNIKEGAQSASLFEIPEGYQKFDMDGMMRGMRPPQ